MIRRSLLILCLVLACVVRADAQSPSRSGSLDSATCPGSGCITLAVNGLSAVGIQLTGTWTATVQFEGSIDGATYAALNMTPTGSVTPATSASANDVWLGNCGGLAIVRVRVSAFTSGTVLATIQAAPGPPIQ